jgi:hypothetical protein
LTLTGLAVATVEKQSSTALAAIQSLVFIDSSL